MLVKSSFSKRRSALTPPESFNWTSSITLNLKKVTYFSFWVKKIKAKPPFSGWFLVKWNIFKEPSSLTVKKQLLLISVSSGKQPYFKILFLKINLKTKIQIRNIVKKSSRLKFYSSNSDWNTNSHQSKALILWWMKKV